MFNGYYFPKWINKDVLHALSINDEPPTLYSLMNSYVNFNKEESEKVKIINLPSAFRTYLFDFDYPIDPLLKESFEENFLTHYMFRRIGFDTYMTFKIHLKDKLNQIMSKYNKLLLEFNNLDFLGVAETHVRTVEAESSSSSSGSSAVTSDNRYSDEPQNLINDVKSGNYMTDFTYNQQEGYNTAGASGSNSSEENITIHRGDSSDEYIKIQNKINNIYESIYKECDSLFYGLPSF